MIGDSLQLSAVVLSWIPMAFLMTSAMCVLVAGRLADLFGRKKIFLIGTFCIIASSLLAAFSVDAVSLITARSLQGVSAALNYSTQVALISSVMPAAIRGRAIAWAITCVYIGLASGPVLGGLALDWINWRAVFLIQIPLSLAALIIGVCRVKEDWFGNREGGVDIEGAFYYALGIATICVAVSQLPDFRALFIFVAGLIILALFIKRSLRKSHPLWDLKLFFSNRIFSFSCLAAFIIYSATYANVVLVSLYLQYLQNFSASAAGAVMMVQPLVMALFSPVAARLAEKFEPRIVASLGMGLTGLSLLLLSTIDQGSRLWAIILPLMLTGLGFSLFSSPNVNAIMGAVSPKFFGSASATVAMMRILGQLSSMILVALCIAFVLGPVQISSTHFEALNRAIQLCFLLAAGLCLPGLISSMVRGRVHR
ncbi:MFS transporter [Aurantivibrio infirmus]